MWNQGISYWRNCNQCFYFTSIRVFLYKNANKIHKCKWRRKNDDDNPATTTKKSFPNKKYIVQLKCHRQINSPSDVDLDHIGYSYDWWDHRRNGHIAYGHIVHIGGWQRCQTRVGYICPHIGCPVGWKIRNDPFEMILYVLGYAITISAEKERRANSYNLQKAEIMLLWNVVEKWLEEKKSCSFIILEVTNT